MGKASGYIISIIVSLFLTGRACAQSLPVSVSPMRFEMGAYPGQTISGTASFWNGTEYALSVQAEADNFTPEDESGQVVVSEDGEAPHSLKSWVTIINPLVTVSPRQNIKYDFALDVPKNATPGAYWGTLLIRTLVPSDADGSGISVKIGPLILLQVYGEAKEGLALESFSARRFVESLPITLTTRLKNTGNTLVKPKGRIEIRNAFGSVAAVLQLPEANTLPGYIRRIDVSANDGFSLGRYTATLKATYGKPEQTISAQLQFWVIPWKSLGLKVLIFGGLIFFIIRKRKNFKTAFDILRKGQQPGQERG